MSDYQRMAKAIEYIVASAQTQPQLKEVAAHVNMSPFHFQRTFGRWVGTTPKRFLQALTLERAKSLLNESYSVLETAHEVGLSSSSRLYDHFVQLEAMTPGDYKLGASGLHIKYGIHQTPFGEAYIALTHRGICQLGFIDYEGGNVRDILVRKWPSAVIKHDQSATAAVMKRLFSTREASGPISLHVRGTNFQFRVWQALLRIPAGRLATYSQIAEYLGQKRSARGVGSAVGANPVALLIPCHRVIRKTGHLGGYHWGEIRMHAIHAWESARND